MQQGGVLQGWLHGLVAQTAPADAQGPGLVGMAMPWMLILGAMYFLIIRPQQKQQRETQDFLAQLKKGDDVVTAGGLIGRIVSVADAEVTLEVAAGVKVRVLKSSVASAAKAPAPAEGEAGKKS